MTMITKYKYVYRRYISSLRQHVYAVLRSAAPYLVQVWPLPDSCKHELTSEMPPKYTQQQYKK